ncbi:GNAT family N-acetyltransferase [Paenibacillus guangzhouensis]|uniref:GNAT family N-acetyltransferase n=1 Tax=Paenibacillus guangzhouensis TaxID=1473112 RepID=UPI001267308B|nr:GNAT family N-acetyltransferase [Paenibacillus guangzhouensis]
MSEQVRLVKPTVTLEQAYVDFYQDWIASGEDIVPWVVSKDPADFEALVKFQTERERGENIPENWVPDSTYWLVSEQDKVIGAVNIRHELNDKLFQSGGHIGYGIRPSERQKGYATKLLALALHKTKELGISKALVVCDATNIGSERTIRNNGGVEDTDFIEEDGNVLKRFWITN